MKVDGLNEGGVKHLARAIRSLFRESLVHLEISRENKVGQKGYVYLALIRVDPGREVREIKGMLVGKAKQSTPSIVQRDSNMHYHPRKNTIGAKSGGVSYEREKFPTLLYPLKHYYKTESSLTKMEGNPYRDWRL